MYICVSENSPTFYFSSEVSNNTGGRMSGASHLRLVIGGSRPVTQIPVTRPARPHRARTTEAEQLRKS